MILSLVFFLCGCAAFTEDSSNTKEEAVSRDEFFAYYEFTEEELGDYDLEEYLSVYQWTEENVEQLNREYMLSSMEDYFSNKNLSYALYFTGEKKDYIEYDNILYLVYAEYSEYANSNRGMIYDFVENKCYYSWLYGSQLSYRYTEEDVSIVVIENSANTRNLWQGRDRNPHFRFSCIGFQSYY